MRERDRRKGEKKLLTALAKTRKRPYECLASGMLNISSIGAGGGEDSACNGILASNTVLRIAQRLVNTVMLAGPRKSYEAMGAP